MPQPCASAGMCHVCRLRSLAQLRPCPCGQNWPSRGRLPVYVAFGEPMRAEDGETVAQFSERITKEVSGLVDYATTYRANEA